MTTFVDTSIIFSIKNGDEVYSAWSQEAILEAERPLIVSDMVFAELAASARNIEEVRQILREMAMEHASPSEEALFLAGQAFAEFRRNGGNREKKPADLLIAAHSFSEDCQLLTANPRDVRNYFPQLRIVCPEGV